MSTPDQEKAPEQVLPESDVNDALIQQEHPEQILTSDLQAEPQAAGKRVHESSHAAHGRIRNVLRKDRDNRGKPNGSTKGKLARANNYWRREDEGIIYY